MAGTPLITDADKKIHLNSLEALAFGHLGHGIPDSDYSNQYLVVFDLSQYSEHHAITHTPNLQTLQFQSVCAVQPL